MASPIALSHTREEAAAAIAEQIKLGRDLCRRRAPTPNLLRELVERCVAWSAFNRATLERLFTIDTIASEYAAEASAQLTPWSETLTLEQLRAGVDALTSKLNQILVTLPLYGESA